MSTIIKLRLWDDPGFTEGCVEVPGIDNTLPEPTQFLVQDHNPNTGDLFSKLTIAAPYDVVMNTSYMQVNIKWDHTEQEQIFYGWVDGVSIKSDTLGFAATNIHWHVDLWRTYLKHAKFGYGMVMRRPMKDPNEDVPPQPYPFRNVHSTDVKWKICGDSDVWWVFINVNKGIGETNFSNTYACPVSITSPAGHLTVGSGTGPTLNSFIDGSWDEKLGLVPENVKGVFLSPLAPNVYASGHLAGWNAGKASETASDSVFIATGLNSITEFAFSLPESFKTDDVTRLVLTGLDGEVVGEIPWGMSVSTLYSRCVIDSTSAYIQIRPDVNGHAEGMCFTIPMIPVELSQNSWSSYAWTGTRQADIDQRMLGAEVNRHGALQNTITSTIPGALQGAIGGFMMGGPIGAVAGAGASLFGAGMSALSAQATYNYQTGYVNDRVQAISDYRAANQPNGLIMSGTGFDTIRYGNKGIMLLVVQTDKYSQDIRDKDIELFGAHVCEPTEDCTALVQAGGGLMITNLIVKGNIPVEAKAYIKARLQGGVRIV